MAPTWADQWTKQEREVYKADYLAGKSVVEPNPSHEEGSCSSCDAIRDLRRQADHESEPRDGKATQPGCHDIDVVEDGVGDPIGLVCTICSKTWNVVSKDEVDTCPTHKTPLQRGRCGRCLAGQEANTTARRQTR